MFIKKTNLIEFRPIKVCDLILDVSEFNGNTVLLKKKSFLFRDKKVVVLGGVCFDAK